MATHRFRSIVAAWLITTATSGAVRADPASLDTIVQQAMSEGHIPGLAFAVVERGKEVAAGVYGKANLETDSPVSRDSVFELASVTKPMTATAIMLLVQDGKLSLSDSITKYIDNAPATWRAITVGELLSQTSGLPEEAIVSCNGAAVMDVSTKAQFDLVASLPLQFKPGAASQYSDPGYFLLGMIIERVSGQTYRAFMQSRIFDPLGMAHTSVLDQARILSHRVSPYAIGEKGELRRARRDWQHELPSYFGVWSTIGDMEKFSEALSSDVLLKKPLREEMWTPAKLVDGKDAILRGRFPYGLGWVLLPVNGHRAILHDGYTGTFLMDFPDDGFGIVVLSNLEFAPGDPVPELVFEIASRLRPDIVPPTFKP